MAPKVTAPQAPSTPSSRPPRPDQVWGMLWRLLVDRPYRDMTWTACGDIRAPFETLLRVPIRSKNKPPLFGPDNTLMSGAEYPDTVFRKRDCA